MNQIVINQRCLQSYKIRNFFLLNEVYSKETNVLNLQCVAAVSYYLCLNWKDVHIKKVKRPLSYVFFKYTVAQMFRSHWNFKEATKKGLKKNNSQTLFTAVYVFDFFEQFVFTPVVFLFFNVIWTVVKCDRKLSKESEYLETLKKNERNT